MTLIRYAAFDGVKDREPKGKIESWDILLGRLTRHQNKPANAEGKQATGALWSPTVYGPGETRSASGVELVTCFVADIDDGTHPGELMERWEGLTWCLHSSFSSTLETPKWRAIFPLKRAVPAGQWECVWRTLNEALMGGHCDAHTKDPSRIYFWPSAPAERMEEAFADYQNGELLDLNKFEEVEAPLAPVTRPLPRPTPPSESRGELRARLLDKYTSEAAPGKRNPTAFALGAQLRDNGFSEGEALQTLEEFKGRMGQGFDDDMNHIAAQVFKRSPRDPWTVPTPTVKPQFGESRVGATGESETHLWTELDHAGAFAGLICEQFRYDTTRGRWMLWDGRVWAEDKQAKIEQAAQAYVRSLWSIPKPEDADESKKWKSLIVAFHSDRKIRALLSLVKSDERLVVTSSVWDRDPWVLNTTNGIVDLRNGELKAHDPLAYCTMIAGTHYDPEAKCPQFEQCLATWQPDPTVRAFLQRESGYELTGSCREQTAFLNYGTGANGKSVYQGSKLGVMGVQGGYAGSVSAAFLLDVQKAGQATPELTKLIGRRLIVVGELPSGRRLNDSLLKDLTGEDYITARFLYGEMFDFRPQFKLCFNANHKPGIDGSDPAIRRRLPLVGWKQTIPSEQRDKGLADKLREEYPGILAWMVRGCLAWQDQGLNPPLSVLEDTQAYHAEMDKGGGFLEECCIKAQGAYVTATALRDAYEKWAHANGEKFLMNPNQFAERLRAFGAEGPIVKKIAGKAARVWGGVGLLGEFDDPSEPLGGVFGSPVTPEVTPQNGDSPLRVTPVTPVTPLSHCTHENTVYARTYKNAVTGVTGVTEEKETSSAPKKEPTETELHGKLHGDFNTGRVRKRDPAQADLYSKLLERSLKLQAQQRGLTLSWRETDEGKAVWAQMLALARWWASESPQEGTHD